MTARASNMFGIQLDGTALTDDVVAHLDELVVEDELNVPDIAELVFHDQTRELLGTGRFRIGARLAITARSEATPAGEPLFDGEIVAVELDLAPDRTSFVVRAYDQTHRLQRGTRTETHLDVTYGDVAGKVADRRGLQRGQLGEDRVVHEAVVQWNQTDFEFLAMLAGEINHEVVVADGRLHFRAPTVASSGPSGGTLETHDSTQLVVGANLVRLRATVTSGEQVEEVQVRGWDPKTKQAVEGSARQQSEAGSAAAGARPSELAGTFHGGAAVFPSLALASKEVADAAARSLVEQLASASAELDGVAHGNAALRAGVTVSVANAGAPFDGRYTLTSCRHTFDPDGGYLTAFRVSGRQKRSLLGLVNGHGGGAHHTINGVVPAIVSNIDDPDKQGRVKVAFPWLAERAESYWARVASPGAGKERGLMLLPEVDDEVLVAFDHGDPRLPYVVGSLHNGKDAWPLDPGEAISGNEVVKRSLVSRKGHRVLFDDKDDTVTVEIKDGGYKLVLDKPGTLVTIASDGSVKIEAKQDVTVKANGAMTLEAAQALSIKGMGVSIDAGGGAFEAKGTSAKVQGSATAELSSSGQTKVQGTMVQIN